MRRVAFERDIEVYKTKIVLKQKVTLTISKSN